MGKSSIENGEVLVVRTIAANPLQTEKYPDKCFDKEVCHFLLFAVTLQLIF